MDLRHEYKYMVNLGDIILIRSRLENIAARDSHCNDEGTYNVKSLYFDNYSDKALREKTDGVNIREKFRIRYYNSDLSFIRLEKKSKINGLCSKQSCILPYEKCKDISEGRWDTLLSTDNVLAKELYAKMNFQLLRPKNIVSYTRECFVYPSGNVRITIDTHIGGSLNTAAFLDTKAEYPAICPYNILEIKYDEYLPDIIKNAVTLHSRRAGAFSKYAAVRYV